MALVKVRCGVGSSLLFATGRYVGNDYIAVWKALLLSDVQTAVKQDMVWIYLLPSTQQTIGYNGFITKCFDSHESSSGYVQNLSVLAVLLLRVSCSGVCWSV
jgi:hypothetical protein